jgi:hypothetical protein
MLKKALAAIVVIVLYPIVVVVGKLDEIALAGEWGRDSQGCEDVQ